MANGPEPLADSIISQVLESKQRQGKPMDEVESCTPAFEWQLLHGRGGDPINGKTLAEAVQIFSVWSSFTYEYVLPTVFSFIFCFFSTILVSYSLLNRI